MNFNKSEKFIIIFGSIARNDYNKHSDIDILTINIDKESSERYINNLNLPRFPHNYVEYDTETFVNFYNSGSLFLYHIFTQGIPVYGNIDKWEQMKKKFNVKNFFHEEISKIKDEVSIYSNINIFDNHYISAISNIYPMIKNFCIFSLANIGVYEFNKESCIKLHIKNQELISLINKAKRIYEYSEKSIEYSNTEQITSNLEQEIILKEIYKFISE